MYVVCTNATVVKGSTAGKPNVVKPSSMLVDDHLNAVFQSSMTTGKKGRVHPPGPASRDWGFGLYCCREAPSGSPPPDVSSQLQVALHSFIHVTPVAEAHLSSTSPFQTPLITPNNKLIKPTNKDNFLPG
jgi:hypothetical protein